MGILLCVSEAIDRVLAAIARAAGWLFPALVVLICWDIVTRKMGFQLPGFGSTPVQELEWHLHGALFLFWIGYAYVRNVHVRIDVFIANMSPQRQARLEIFGILFFATPYLLVATWYAFQFAHTSFVQNEMSDAPNGLTHRWIIKGCLFLGFMLMNLAVVSVLFRKIVFLCGPPDLSARAQPEPEKPVSSGTPGPVEISAGARPAPARH